MRAILERLRRLALSSTDRAGKAQEAAELVRAARNYHWVGLYDVSPTEIAAIAWTGATAPAFPRFPVTRGLNGAAVASRRPVVVQDVTRDPRYLTTFGSTRAEAVFVVASSSDGRIIGTIDVESGRPNAFTPEDEAFLGSCAEALVPLWSSERPESTSNQPRDNVSSPR
jgi:GAF domain-containing protein